MRLVMEGVGLERERTNEGQEDEVEENRVKGAALLMAVGEEDLRKGLRHSLGCVRVSCSSDIDFYAWNKGRKGL